MFVETKKEGEAQVQLEPWRKLLLDAADLMEKRGKCVGVFTNDATGSVCVMGALNLLSTGSPRNWMHDDDYEAMERLKKFIGTNYIDQWNDDHTKKEVLAALRACARQ